MIGRTHTHDRARRIGRVAAATAMAGFCAASIALSAPAATASPVQYPQIHSATMAGGGSASTPTGVADSTASADPDSMFHTDAVLNLGLTRAEAKHLQKQVLRHFDYTGSVDGQLGSSSWKAMQRYLKRMGMYGGPIDGIPGSKTYMGLQKDLRAWHWYSGKIDGIPGVKTRAGFKQFATRVDCAKNWCSAT